MTEMKLENISKQICAIAQTITESCEHIAEQELAKKLEKVSESLRRPEHRHLLGHSFAGHA